MNNQITIPQAIKKLFDIEVSKESPYIKDKANSFVRNKLIKVVTEQKVQRKSVYLKDSQQLDALYNALLLNAFYPDPKHVQQIFNNEQYRIECAETIRSLFGQRNNLAGQTLISNNVSALIEALESQLDLFCTRLPNPFHQLPQIALGKNTGLLNCLLLQASALEPIDNVLVSITNGDWEKAQHLAITLSDDVSGALQLKKMINDKLEEAQEFDDLLNFFSLR